MSCVVRRRRALGTADGEPEVVEQFHGILTCSTLGGRLTKGKTFFFSFESR